MSADFPMIALIPARAGSQRIPGKNMRPLAGRPLLVHTLAAAYASGVFAAIVLATDDPRAMGVGHDCRGDLVVHQREPVPDTQADIVWVRDALATLPRPDCFAILRPTSPFRTAETIRRAYRQFFLPDQTADSLRAVEPVRQHPYKMWTLDTPVGPLRPLRPGSHRDGTPYHSSPTQSLPVFYVQNSALEMAWTRNVEVDGTISGRKIAPFFTEGYEGFSLDYPEDWDRAEHLLASGAVTLPSRTP